MQESFENSVKNMLTIIGEDPNREGLIKTPERVYKAFKFLTSGYEQDPKEVLGDALLLAQTTRWFSCEISSFTAFVSTICCLLSAACMWRTSQMARSLGLVKFHAW